MVFNFLKKKPVKKAVKKTVKKKAVKKKVVKKKIVKKKVVKKKAVKKKSGKKKPAFGGYQILPDEALGKIIGNKPVTPAEMTKKIWKYIKSKQLSNR